MAAISKTSGIVEVSLETYKNFLKLAKPFRLLIVLLTLDILKIILGFLMLSIDLKTIWKTTGAVVVTAKSVKLFRIRLVIHKHIAATLEKFLLTLNKFLSTIICC